jgi:DHA2 family multidrug resistance protein
MIFVSINVAAFKYTPKHLRGAAVGLMALLRNEGGSVGTSMAQTFTRRAWASSSIPSIPR